jgi:CO/xanthine dehydrogenase Mo-binding subunit
MNLPNPENPSSARSRSTDPPSSMPPELVLPGSGVGATPPRVDARDKVTGRALYADDLAFPGMLHAAACVSEHPHAELLAIDVEEARAIEGVEAIVTAADIPGVNAVGIIFPDQPLLVEHRARWRGDRIALVAAQTPALARHAAKAIRVEARPLPGVFSPEEALAKGAPLLHDKGNILDTMHVRYGNVAEGFAQAEVTLERVYSVNYQEHAYLEPQGCVAVPGAGGAMTIYSSCQCPFYIQKAVKAVLGVDANKIRVIQTATGGAFGGKEDYPSEPAACAALLAWATGRPVKFVYSREEDIAWSSKRHRMTMRFRLGARRDGRLTAAAVRILVDVGAYAGLTTVVAERSNISTIGPYRIDNVEVDTLCVYTNNLFGGAFRGFGAPQVTFAHESILDEMAEQLGMDPLELRRRNAYRPGDRMISGQKLEGSVPCIETLEQAASLCEWPRRRADYDRHNALDPPRRKGLGAATILYGVNLHAGGLRLNRGGAHINIHADASVSISIGLTEMGQGLFTAACQMAAEALGVPFRRVYCNPVDTALVPDSGPTVASRGTVMSGFPLMDAARRLRHTLLHRAAAMLNTSADDLELREGIVFSRTRPDTRIPYEDVVTACILARENLTEVGWYRVPEQPWDKPTGQGIAYHAFAYATQIADVELDVRTGEIAVRGFFCAHDVGRAIHPDMVKAQIEGGVVQGMGWAIMENLQLRAGKCLNPDFTDYLIPTSIDIPEIRIALLEDDPTEHGPFGIKGIGEPSLIPAAAALANAIAHAAGIRFMELPITPEKVLLALEKRVSR